MQFQSEAEEAVWVHIVIAGVGRGHPAYIVMQGADAAVAEYRERRPAGGYSQPAHPEPPSPIGIKDGRGLPDW